MTHTSGPRPSREIDGLAADGDRALFTALTRMRADELEALLIENPAAAVRCIKAAAECGLIQAQLRLGRMLLEGTGVAQDRDIAFLWFSRAAHSGAEEAENMVGRCYENGWGVADDPREAALWYGRAAEKGDAWAQYNLGHLYLDGNGVERDAGVALRCYRQAADQGHDRAMNLVARCHEEGWGTPRDAAAAHMWYERSAQLGYFRGQYNWATCLLNGGRTEEALHFFRAAVESAPPSHRGVIVAALSKSSHPAVKALGAVVSHAAYS